MRRNIRLGSKSLLICFWAAFSISIAADSVRYSLELNRIGSGVRAKGLGNAFVAADPEAASLYWNCAGIADLEKRELYFAHQELYGGISSHTSGFMVLPIPTTAGIGIGYIRFQDLHNDRYGPLEGTLPVRLGNPDLRANGTPASGAWGNIQDELIVATAKQYNFELPRVAFYSMPAPVSIALGASFKFFRNSGLLQNGDEPSRSMPGYNANMDAAFLAQLGLVTDPKTREQERVVSFGGVIQDLLETRVDYRTGYEETTRRVYRAGLSLKEKADWIRGYVLLCVEIDHQYERTEYFGAEYCFQDLFAIRAGLDDRHPSLGASIAYRYFRIDYAYSFHPLAATPLQLGLRIAF